MDSLSPATDLSPRLDALGNIIRDRRRELGLTQTQFGERVKWAQERISTLERGKYGLPSVTGLTRLATGLELPLSTLIAAAGFPDDGVGLDHVGRVQAETAPALLLTVRRLLSIESTDLKGTLNEAATILASAIEADKIDAFLLEPSTATLVALGTSATPMGATQRRLGLHHMPLSGQTREVEVYQTGRFFCSGYLDRDSHIAPGVVDGMGAHSMIAVPLVVNGQRRGVLAAYSAQPDQFSDDDIPFFETAARWVGMVVHRFELLGEITTAAECATRHAALEETITAVAHDLTNHLMPLKGRLGVLRRKLQLAGRTDELNDVKTAAADVVRMEHIVDDLVATTRQEEGLLSLATCERGSP